jgi:hypothetical protein
VAFLIDLTDDRFKIPANDAVIEFIRRVNPFAHTDVGIKLIELGEATAGAQIYCPSYRSCAYVVLHTEAQVIFAIAFGQRQLVLRLPPDVLAAGAGQGGKVHAEIGPDWLGVDAFRSGASDATLLQWAEAACRAATGRGRRP